MAGLFILSYMKSTNPYMKSLALMRKGITDCGYQEHFIVAGHDFRAVNSNKIYSSQDVKILSTLRFSGTNAHSEPETSDAPNTAAHKVHSTSDLRNYHAELYLIETMDGVKGIFERQS